MKQGTLGATLLGNITDPPIDDLTKKYIMGHKTNTDITDRYTHKTIQQLIDAVDRM